MSAEKPEPPRTAAAAPRARKEDGFLRSVGAKSLTFIQHVGKVSEMAFGTIRSLFQRPFEGKEILKQLESVGVASLGIMAVTSVFIGMVMTVQFAWGLRKLGGMEYTGRVMGLSFARELAPTLTAVIVGSRIGAGIAAEVGSMAVTEQIDAIRALGANPLKKLVLPRLIACVIAMPVLSVLALALGVGGAMLVADAQFGIRAPFFLASALNSVTMNDFVSGLYKTPFFGAIIALLGSHFGLTTRGGTAGVGSSTTRTVVGVSITILIADFFLTKVAITFFPPF